MRGWSIFNCPRWLVATVGFSLVALSLQSVHAAPPPFESFPASDLERVFEDGFSAPAHPPAKLSLAGLRGETLSAQCVLLANADLEGLSVSVGPLQQKGGSGVSAPEKLYQARRQAIEETLALEQSPRVVLQTAPLEHSPVGKDCAVDLHGWAEPGTLLTANGETIRVAADGLFLAQIPPSSKGEIVIAATEKGHSKRLVRQFRIRETQPGPASSR